MRVCARAFTCACACVRGPLMCACVRLRRTYVRGGGACGCACVRSCVCAPVEYRSREGTEEYRSREGTRTGALYFRHHVIGDGTYARAPTYTHTRSRARTHTLARAHTRQVLRDWHSDGAAGGAGAAARPHHRHAGDPPWPAPARTALQLVPSHCVTNVPCCVATWLRCNEPRCVATSRAALQHRRSAATGPLRRTPRRMPLASALAQVTEQKLARVAEKETKGAVYSLNAFNGSASQHAIHQPSRRG